MADYEEQLLEFYSLMAPIADVIRDCQGSQWPTGALGHFSLLNIRLNLVNAAMPLKMINPATKQTKMKSTPGKIGRKSGMGAVPK